MKTKDAPIPKAPDEPHYLIVHNPYPRPHGMGSKRWDNASRVAVCQWLCCFIPPECIMCLYTRERPNNIVLVELSHTVDLSKVLGAHYWWTFDKKIPPTSTERTSIFLCKHDTGDEAVRKPGWESGAIDYRFLNNLKPSPHLRHVIWQPPQYVRLVDVFGIGEASYAKENPPPPDGAPPPPPLVVPQYVPHAGPQGNQFQDPRYKDLPPADAFSGPGDGRGRSHTPSYPAGTPRGNGSVHGRGDRSMPGTPGNATSAYMQGNATPAYMAQGSATPAYMGMSNQSMPSTPVNMTPAYASQHRSTPKPSDRGHVPAAFPDYTPPTLSPSAAATPSASRPASASNRTASTSSSNYPSTSAHTAAYGSGSTLTMPPPPPPSTLNRNTADIRSRNAGPASRDPRLRAQTGTSSAAAAPTINTTTLAANAPLTPPTSAVQIEPAVPPYASPITDGHRSPTPFVRPPTICATVAERLSTGGGLFGRPSSVVPTPPPLAISSGQAERASPFPLGHGAAVERGSTISSSSFPSPPPEEVKIEELEDLEVKIEELEDLEVKIEELEDLEADLERDVKPIILPNGEAIDARSLTDAQREMLMERANGSDGTCADLENGQCPPVEWHGIVHEDRAGGRDDGWTSRIQFRLDSV
ncbi:hypothetical protein CALVIDRAFT_530235 [Calocera viscosa TUFC12733]|uniref:Uncharacterized protein n=1 Tax=Calocera viscosa (strain TUFC12733) TaxID=1330018 RepID=A0A167I334_CALVF|nr:hypothetical protein CALVIDRAFT_530235 [Calocera viscosa TUFC12733]